MISEYCSRHPFCEGSSKSIAENFVNFVAHNSVPGSLTLTDVAKATQEDCVLKCVTSAIKNNTWSKEKCKMDEVYRKYKQVQDELSVLSMDIGNILLRGTRLCIPESLKRHVIDLAHEGHQGQTKCKSLLRETLWFPYMDKLVEEKCKSCIACMSVSPHSVPDPIKPSSLPMKPWDEVSMDFCGPFPTGEYFMVVIDDYSRYPVVEKLMNIKADTVTVRLENIFGIFGIPSVIKTDNGAPFNGHVFSEFANAYGFRHRRITPLHPMSNATAEAFMKPLVKAIKTSNVQGQNWKSALSKFLLNYRSTPHPSTGVSPGELMFNRRMKTKLPQLITKSKDTVVRKRDTKIKT